MRLLDFLRRLFSPKPKGTTPTLSQQDLSDRLTAYSYEYVRAHYGPQGDTPDGALCEVVELEVVSDKPSDVLSALDRAIDTAAHALSARLGRKPSGVGITPFQRTSRYGTFMAALYETLPAKA